MEKWGIVVIIRSSDFLLTHHLPNTASPRTPGEYRDKYALDLGYAPLGKITHCCAAFQGGEDVPLGNNTLGDCRRWGRRSRTRVVRRYLRKPEDFLISFDR